MKINNIEINDIIINEIKNLKDKGYYFTTYNIFEILEQFLYQEQILQLLNISQSSFYKYKRERKNKFIDRKLYEFYLLITNESFKEHFEKCDTIYLEWLKNVWHLHNFYIYQQKRFI